MSYSPNILNKGDIVYINGTRFRVLHDFNAQGIKLTLKKEINQNVYVAYSGLGEDGCKQAREIYKRE